MGATPTSALGPSLGCAGPDPYGPYGQPTTYDSFGHSLVTNPTQDPLPRAFSMISWATSTAPPHETHLVEDSMHPSPVPTPVSLPPKPQFPSSPPEISEFTEVSQKRKGKNKGLSLSTQTPKKSFAAIALSSLPVSGIQCKLAKINKPNSAPVVLPSGASAAKPKQSKQNSPVPPGNLELIIKVSTDPDRKLILSQANMPDSCCGLMSLVTHFNNLVNSKEYQGKTSIMPIQFSYGTNSNCYISFLPVTKVEEVELFHSAVAS
ncbi:hypothetical protein CTheo_9086 [Ceratobasidium theobromae]|uniref:Uncharacterized protein n=1 Tax=Ceratobasidium theobromae TaxID=1582974 RepID=A0A5N5Q7T9_9AGAM|nr:hypothetical protein CTheo_9086 [Ceratobasidium theobromae]